MHQITVKIKRCPLSVHVGLSASVRMPLGVTRDVHGPDGFFRKQQHFCLCDKWSPEPHGCRGDLISQVHQSHSYTCVSQASTQFAHMPRHGHVLTAPDSPPQPSENIALTTIISTRSPYSTGVSPPAAQSAPSASTGVPPLEPPHPPTARSLMRVKMRTMGRGAHVGFVDLVNCVHGRTPLPLKCV